MAAQTESTYISENVTDIVKIPTANLRFSTTASSESVPGRFQWWQTTGNGRQDRKIWQHRTSNGKSGVYEQSVGKWLQEQSTTENSDMTAKTGNNYLWSCERRRNTNG